MLASAALMIFIAGWLHRQHAGALGTWRFLVERRSLVLRILPDAVTLHQGGTLLARNSISPAQPRGTMTAGLFGSGHTVTVRYAVRDGVASAAVMVGGELVAGTIVDGTDADTDEAIRLLRRLSAGSHPDLPALQGELHSAIAVLEQSRKHAQHREEEGLVRDITARLRAAAELQHL